MKNNLKIILQNVKKEITQLYKANIIKFFLVGSAIEIERNPRELDIVVIVKDTSNLYDFVRNISPILANLTKNTGILVSCFPIYEKDFPWCPWCQVYTFYKLS